MKRKLTYAENYFMRLVKQSFSINTYTDILKFKEQPVELKDSKGGSKELFLRSLKKGAVDCLEFNVEIEGVDIELYADLDYDYKKLKEDNDYLMKFVKDLYNLFVEDFRDFATALLKSGISLEKQQQFFNESVRLGIGAELK